METPRLTLILLMCVVLCSLRRISGEEVEMKVRPGENLTLYCDLSLTAGSFISWIRNCSHENQPSLVMDYKIFETTKHFSFIHNTANNSHDLHITNISVSDLGLYYCVKTENKVNKDERGIISGSKLYQYGNRTTRLSLAADSAHESTIASTSPPVSECVFCWTLLLSVCPVCVLLSSLLSSICVYCFCRPQTTGSDMSAEILKANVFMADCVEKHQCEVSKTGKICVHTEVSYRRLTSKHPYTNI
ncbi:uncharacterized protein LOC130215676 isoform X1 [Danio aesculapii]|uniref:uncharacterized protein LOC130215676 isoform X1 n=1 Tax=Danio aesculapii TaxID=1142201 RepID=UPI0024BF9EA8|nr:uncharacterized protein LOC130215676 isoform X1 [Danio aesculapii]